MSPGRARAASTSTAAGTRSKRIDLVVQLASVSAEIPARRLLKRWVSAAAERRLDTTIRFVDEDEGRALNRTYRRKDRATNVLSFVYDDAPDRVCGDIVLCMPVLEREAHASRKSVEAHCAHLVVHGVLHLQGYDHQRVRDAVAMEARERAILAGLGFPDPYS